ncbi:MAG: HD domain-containing protein [Sulfurimonas sp.]
MDNKKLYEIRPLIYSTEIRDAYTQGHSEHVAYYARELASVMGLSKKECSDVYIAGLLHDVGKIGIPDSVLLKPGRLEFDEYDLIKLHSDISGKIVEKIPNFAYLREAVRHHHEDFNGGGYPDGLVGEEIPLFARILSVVDVFDALTTGRIYRASMDFKKALTIMEKMQKSTKFDPKIYAVFIPFIKKLGIYKDHKIKDVEFEELEKKRNTFFFKDSMTNLLNRDALLALLRKSHDYAYTVSLIICNIKQFKVYNQKYGLEKGDYLLKDIGFILKKRLRARTSMKEPEQKDLFLFRLRGDEFVVLNIGNRSDFLSHKLEQISDKIYKDTHIKFEYTYILKCNKVSRSIENEIGYLL